MAFPTTGILDNFNRANENPAVGWTADWYNLGNLGIKVVSNEAVSIAAPTGLCNAYMPAVYGADQEAYGKMPAKPDADNDFIVTVRIQNPDSASLNAYFAQLTVRSGTDEVNIWKVVNNVSTLIAGPISQEFAAGDQLGIEAIGTTITAYRHNGTSWASVTSVVNGDVTGTGSVGVAFNSPISGLGSLDDFGGGTVVTGTANPTFVPTQPFLRW